MGDKGYIEVTLPGVAQDWKFGWLIGLEDERIDSLNPDAVQRLVLEVMTRGVTQHPDNFAISPEFVFGDKQFDLGYNAASPASQYINPPMQFVPDEGVLVYLVNDKIPEAPGAPYMEWYNFGLALLNPAGNDQRDNLNNAALDAGETMSVDFRTLIPERSVPVKITVDVVQRGNDYATVHISRQVIR